PVDAPQIAHRRHLDVVLVLELRRDPVQLAAAVANPDVAERDAIVGAEDAAVGKRRRRHGSAHRHLRALTQERTAIDGRRWRVVLAHGGLRETRARRAYGMKVNFAWPLIEL